MRGGIGDWKESEGRVEIAGKGFSGDEDVVYTDINFVESTSN